MQCYIALYTGSTVGGGERKQVVALELQSNYLQAGVNGIVLFKHWGLNKRVIISVLRTS